MGCPCAFGIVALTSVFIAFVVVLDYRNFNVPECLDEPCNSEGVDNYVVNWASDFLVAMTLLSFGLHLHFGRRVVDSEAVLGQVLMGTSYIFFGVAHWIFPNDATGDGRGMRPYWILSWMAYVFVLLSTMHIAFFVTNVSPKAVALRRRWCGKYMIHLLLGLVIACSIAFFVGCIWCAISSEILVNQAIDKYAETGEHPECVQLIETSEIAWYCCYALFWIPTALVLRDAAKLCPETILGLPTPSAAVDIILVQLTIGPLYNNWVILVSALLDEDRTKLFQQAHGSVVTHYGVLLTFYLLHNLSSSLSSVQEPRAQRTAKVVADSSDDDIEKAGF